jgi:hypothetical protein
MQTATGLWTRDTRGFVPRPRRLHGQPGMLGGAMKCCQQCDIPLGSRPCPNPLCPEQHGQSVGDLCIWCYQNSEERRDGIDMQAWA